jgi:thiaminase/transcriptional activator TenA
MAPIGGCFVAERRGGEPVGSYHETLIKENRDLVDRARDHPFMTQIAAGTIPKERFLGWLSQNYHWTRNFEHFLATLGGHAPRALRQQFCQAMLNLHREIELFEEFCAKTGAKLTESQVNLACDSYANFLTAAVQTRTFEEALVACYASNYVFCEAWKRVRDTQAKPGPWQDFVELWTHEGFTEWVNRLADFVDQSAESATSETRKLMAQTFPKAISYSIRFWASALDGGEDW